MKRETSLPNLDIPGFFSNFKSRISIILLYILLFVGVIVTLFPFAYMFILASSSEAQIASYPPPLWFGGNARVNLEILLGATPFFRNMLNSLIVAVSATLGTLFFCSLGGYGFAMYDFKGKEKLFFLMLVTIMIPGLLSIIPWFVLMSWLGWVNTFYPLIIPGMANAMGIFLMRQFMEGVPKDLVEAARIDGCNEFGIYWRVVLPLVKPGLGALGIITFLGSWNNYLSALIILQSKIMQTFPVALTMVAGKIKRNYGAQIIGAAMAIIPIIIVFLLASKQFIAGITSGATKG